MMLGNVGHMGPVSRKGPRSVCLFETCRMRKGLCLVCTCEADFRRPCQPQSCASTQLQWSHSYLLLTR